MKINNISSTLNANLQAKVKKVKIKAVENDYEKKLELLKILNDHHDSKIYNSNAQINIQDGNNYGLGST